MFEPSYYTSPKSTNTKGLFKLTEGEPSVRLWHFAYISPTLSVHAILWVFFLSIRVNASFNV